jgi:transposase-like protein
MTQFNLTVNGEKLKDLLVKDNGLRDLLEDVVNQVLEAQMSEYIGAKPYERTNERKAYRNGYRIRQLYTRVGPLSLQVPQTRDGGFSTAIFKRYQRSEQAFVLGLMEMVLNGVSTRKVTKVTEELCGVSFSRSTVSNLCKNLDRRVEAWNNRSLKDTKYPFIIVDAMMTRARKDGAGRFVHALIALGINKEGHREILGLTLGDSESEHSWSKMFSWLRKRGITGVDYVISDQHSGLTNAVRKHFQGAIWQRCQVHLRRNVFSDASYCLRPQLAAGMKRIFKADTREEGWEQYEKLVTDMAGKGSKALKTLERGLEDSLAILALPEKYRVRLRTTNMLERLHSELRRRERVIRIFPNEASVVRMIGALLAEQHEVWSTGRRYLDMTEYNDWKAEQQQENKNVVKLNVS